MHEPSGLEPDSSQAWLEPFEPGGATSRLESLGNRSLGGSNRGPRADLSLLAARAGSDTGRGADSTLDSSLLAVSWRLEPSSPHVHEPAREQHYSGIRRYLQALSFILVASSRFLAVIMLIEKRATLSSIWVRSVYSRRGAYS